MKLVLNGEVAEFPDGMSILDLVNQLELNPLKVAIERNLEVVPRSLHQETKLCDGDRVEVVQFVGGG